MSDVPPPVSIGEVVDAANADTASNAADQAAAQVANQIPEPSSTTVVVEPEQTDVTATGLDAAAHMRQIAREETDAYMTELIAMDAANQAAKQPDVVVITPEPTPPPTEVAGTPSTPEPPPELAPDEAPPMAHDHPYYRPLTKRKRKS